MTAGYFFSHPASFDHDTGEHPECAARIAAIERHLEALDWLGYERREAPRVDPELLDLVHAPAYVWAIERFCARGGGAIDGDTFLTSGSWEAALRAAGGAVALVDVLLGGGATGFAAGRPPGHHALRGRAMGFCVFNNVALAAAHARRAHGVERTMILDWDVHHGNGTNDLFHASPDVYYVSIHQAELFPATGPPTDHGEGAGDGYTLNLPVPPGSGDEVFCGLVEEHIVPLTRRYAPQLVLISAGYDAHEEDPLADCRVSDGGFAAMTASMRDVCAELGAPLGAVLEGGYALDALGRSVAVTLRELAAAPSA
jgi:acetoin utilization deacetylase AcuC-like enzyme